MASDINNHKPLVVITGPTASGKTSLAVDLAEVWGGEIICADSRSIYKGMDIGTAKPSQSDISRVPHWALDLVEPGQYFSVADFKNYATKMINDIRSRGKIPFLGCGTGLYVDAVIFDFKFGEIADVDKREKLNNMTLEQLHDYCLNNNINLPENSQNKRYVIRNIERKDANASRRDSPIDNTIVVGISTDREILRSRISIRVEQIFNDGVVKEAKVLGDMYDWRGEAFTGNVYPLVRQYIDGKISLEDVKSKLITLDWRLAKRQLTWMKRNKFIEWGSIDDTKKYLSARLAKLV